MTIERLRGDAGIGMTELAVAIVVLGVILVGLFPLVINSIGLAQQNSETGQANRILSTQLDVARQQLETAACAASPSPGAALDLSSNDSAKFEARRIVACDGRLATVTITVSRQSGSSGPLATATTQVVTAS